ncbi:unnamed protein product [Calicophoron daubneyi]|uniref:Uncharacterized protein n=1 Tax=Calicophoron daubneyi TaxID=300641 RepID=A0AAV2TR79_CALDB
MRQSGWIGRLDTAAPVEAISQGDGMEFEIAEKKEDYPISLHPQTGNLTWIGTDNFPVLDKSMRLLVNVRILNQSKAPVMNLCVNIFFQVDSGGGYRWRSTDSQSESGSAVPNELAFVLGTAASNFPPVLCSGCESRMKLTVKLPPKITRLEIELYGPENASDYVGYIDDISLHRKGARVNCELSKTGEKLQDVSMVPSAKFILDPVEVSSEPGESRDFSIEILYTIGIPADSTVQDGQILTTGVSIAVNGKTWAAVKDITAIKPILSEANLTGCPPVMEPGNIYKLVLSFTIPVPLSKCTIEINSITPSTTILSANVMKSADWLIKEEKQSKIHDVRKNVVLTKTLTLNMQVESSNIQYFGRLKAVIGKYNEVARVQAPESSKLRQWFSFTFEESRFEDFRIAELHESYPYEENHLNVVTYVQVSPLAFTKSSIHFIAYLYKTNVFVRSCESNILMNQRIAVPTSEPNLLVKSPSTYAKTSQAVSFDVTVQFPPLPQSSYSLLVDISKQTNAELTNAMLVETGDFFDELLTGIPLLIVSEKHEVDPKISTAKICLGPITTSGENENSFVKIRVEILPMIVEQSTSGSLDMVGFRVGWSTNSTPPQFKIIRIESPTAFWYPSNFSYLPESKLEKIQPANSDPVSNYGAVFAWIMEFRDKYICPSMRLSVELNSDTTEIEDARITYVPSCFRSLLRSGAQLKSNSKKAEIIYPDIAVECEENESLMLRIEIALIPKSDEKIYGNIECACGRLAYNKSFSFNVSNETNNNPLKLFPPGLIITEDNSFHLGPLYGLENVHIILASVTVYPLVRERYSLTVSTDQLEHETKICKPRLLSFDPRVNFNHQAPTLHSNRASVDFMKIFHNGMRIPRPGVLAPGIHSVTYGIPLIFKKSRQETASVTVSVGYGGKEINETRTYPLQKPVQADPVVLKFEARRVDIFKSESIPHDSDPIILSPGETAQFSYVLTVFTTSCLNFTIRFEVFLRPWAFVRGHEVENTPVENSFHLSTKTDKEPISHSVKSLKLFVNASLPLKEKRTFYSRKKDLKIIVQKSTAHPGETLQMQVLVFVPPGSKLPESSLRFQCGLVDSSQEAHCIIKQKRMNSGRNFGALHREIFTMLNIFSNDTGQMVFNHLDLGNVIQTAFTHQMGTPKLEDDLLSITLGLKFSDAVLLLEDKSAVFWVHAQFGSHNISTKTKILVVLDGTEDLDVQLTTRAQHSNYFQGETVHLDVRISLNPSSKLECHQPKLNIYHGDVFGSVSLTSLNNKIVSFVVNPKQPLFQATQFTARGLYFDQLAILTIQMNVSGMLMDTDADVLGVTSTVELICKQYTSGSSASSSASGRMRRFVGCANLNIRRNADPSEVSSYNQATKDGFLPHPFTLTNRSVLYSEGHVFFCDVMIGTSETAPFQKRCFHLTEDESVRVRDLGPYVSQILGYAPGEQVLFGIGNGEQSIVFSRDLGIKWRATNGAGYKLFLLKYSDWITATEVPLTLQPGSFEKSVNGADCLSFGSKEWTGKDAQLTKLAEYGRCLMTKMGMVKCPGSVFLFQSTHNIITKSLKLAKDGSVTCSISSPISNSQTSGSFDTIKLSADKPQGNVTFTCQKVGGRSPFHCFMIGNPSVIMQTWYIHCKEPPVVNVVPDSVYSLKRALPFTLTLLAELSEVASGSSVDVYCFRSKDQGAIFSTSPVYVSPGTKSRPISLQITSYGDQLHTEISCIAQSTDGHQYEKTSSLGAPATLIFEGGIMKISPNRERLHTVKFWLSLTLNGIIRDLNVICRVDVATNESAVQALLENSNCTAPSVQSQTENAWTLKPTDVVFKVQDSTTAQTLSLSRNSYPTKSESGTVETVVVLCCNPSTNFTTDPAFAGISSTARIDVLLPEPLDVISDGGLPSINTSRQGSITPVRITMPILLAFTNSQKNSTVSKTETLLKGDMSSEVANDFQ